MQEQLVAAQQRLAETIVTGTVAGGAVTVTLTGSGELTGVEIKAGGFDGSDADDLTDLGDMIVAAYRDAKSQADALASEALGPLARRRWRARRHAGPRSARVLRPGPRVRRHRPGPHRRARATARGRAEERPADRVPPAAGRGRRRTPPGRRADRGQGQGQVLQHLLQRLRGRPVPDLSRPPSRPDRPVRRGGVQGRRRGRAHPRVPRPLPRAGRRDLADRRHRARSSCGSASCWPDWPTARSPRSSWRPIPTSRARRPRRTSRGC